MAEIRNKKNTKQKKSRMGRAVDEVKSTFASTTAMISSAVTLVAGLAWSDVAKAYFARLKDKLSGWGEAVGLFLYAITVTVIAVLIVRRLKKLQKAVGGKSIK